MGCYADGAQMKSPNESPIHWNRGVVMTGTRIYMIRAFDST